MSNYFIIGETFVNYALVKDYKRAHKAGVFHDQGDETENEERHMSELERRMAALDEKETYVTVKTLVEQHRETVIKTLEYLNKIKEKEGEKKNEAD